MSKSLCKKHKVIEKVDPVDALEAVAASVTVSYSTGSGMHRIPAMFCAFPTPSEVCNANNHIDMN